MALAAPLFARAGRRDRQVVKKGARLLFTSPKSEAAEKRIPPADRVTPNSLRVREALFSSLRAFSVHHEQLGANRCGRAMGFSPVGDLIAHARL